jgi:hypothetical protein
MGDDALGLDRHRDDPQRHPAQHVDHRDDQVEPGCPRALQPAQPEQHALLVLPDDPHRQREPQQRQQHDYDHDSDQDSHGDAPFRSR